MIVSAPMGFLSGGALAAAVTHAGGLGMIGAGYGDADWLREQFRLAGGASVGVGFITWSLARRPELLDLALGYKPRAVMLSFGDPLPFAAKIRAAGTKLILQVQDLQSAQQALRANPDILVAQGTEAGGHGGELSLLALLPAIRDLNPNLPILAAGGIADHRGYRTALALGAEGVLVGTCLIASDEALAAPEAKRRVVQASGDATVRTRVFDIVRGYDWPAPYTGRALRNAFTATWHGNEARLKQNLPEQRKKYEEAARRGDFDTAVIFAGEAVDLVDSILPAAEIVKRIGG